jgi:hypothetical protein
LKGYKILKPYFVLEQVEGLERTKGRKEKEGEGRRRKEKGGKDWDQKNA